jgi:hypothetical protein
VLSAVGAVFSLELATFLPAFIVAVLYTTVGSYSWYWACIAGNNLGCCLLWIKGLVFIEMVHIILQVIDMYDSECTMSASDLEEVADSGDADCSVGAVVKFFKFIALLVTIVPSVALFYFGIQCCACALCNLFPWKRLTLLVADCVDIRRLHAAQVWPPAERRRDTPVDCAHRANAGASASAAPRPTSRSPTTGAATGCWPTIATSTGETLSDAKTSLKILVDYDRSIATVFNSACVKHAYMYGREVTSILGCGHSGGRRSTHSVSLHIHSVQ